METLSSTSNISLGCSTDEPARRHSVYRNWNEYASKRVELGACGQTGRLFAPSLIQERSAAIAAEFERGLSRSASGRVWRRQDWTGNTKVGSRWLATALARWSESKDGLAREITARGIYLLAARFQCLSVTVSGLPD